MSLAWSRNFFSAFLKRGVGRARRLDLFAQGVQYGGKIGLELLNRLAELRDFRPFIGEEQFKKARQLFRVFDRCADDFLPVLDQDRRAGILEYDVVLRIAAPLLLVDFLVEIVFFVLGFPIAEGHAKRIKQRAVDVALFLGGRLEAVFGNEDKIMLTSPSF